MQFIRSRDVVTMIGVSRVTLWRMVRAGDFPPLVRITERSRGYLLETIEDWMRGRSAETACSAEPGLRKQRGRSQIRIMTAQRANVKSPIER